MSDIKFPQVHVQLTGNDGNAFMVMGLVIKEMRRAGLPREDIDAYQNEAMSGDYNHLLVTTMKTVDVL